MRRTALDLPRVISTADAAWYGFTPDAVAHAIESGRWRRITRGVLLTCDETPTRDDWILAGMILTGPQAALSGWDAVRTLGIGARNAPSGRVLILDRSGANRTLAGLHVRPTSRPYRSRLLPFAHPTLPGVPVVEPVRAVCDTALIHRSAQPVRALVASSVQRGLCTPESLAAELRTAPRGGSAHLRLAVEDVLDGARSIAEAEAVDQLRRARVPRFELNVPIVGPGGVVLAVADVLWRELRAIAEIDSREYHFSENDWSATMRRHNLLTGHGFAVGHHPPSDIRARRAGWASEIAGWLRARAAELAVPYVPADGPVRGVPVPFILDQERFGRALARPNLS